MFTRNKVSKDIVAVTYDSTEICLRKSGKKYFGTERCAVKLIEGKLMISKKILDRFGIELEILE